MLNVLKGTSLGKLFQEVLRVAISRDGQSMLNLFFK
jgi:hypothetical protein